MPKIPRLTARVSQELYRRVKLEAVTQGVTIDRFIEDAIVRKMAEKSTSLSDTMNFADAPALPEAFLADAVSIYNESIETFWALARVMGAISRGVLAKPHGKEEPSRSQFKPVADFTEEDDDDAEDKVG